MGAKLGRRQGTFHPPHLHLCASTSAPNTPFSPVGVVATRASYPPTNLLTLQNSLTRFWVGSVSFHEPNTPPPPRSGSGAERRAGGKAASGNGQPAPIKSERGANDKSAVPQFYKSSSWITPGKCWGEGEKGGGGGGENFPGNDAPKRFSSGALN